MNLAKRFTSKGNPRQCTVAGTYQEAVDSVLQNWLEREEDQVNTGLTMINRKVQKANRQLRCRIHDIRSVA
jgi:hypothetical protein